MLSFPKIKKCQLVNLPIPEAESSTQEKIESLAKRILSESEPNKETLQQEIDSIINKLYGLTEEEISQLENGDTLKPLYEKCIHIIANSFMINLEEMNFQSYITKNTSIQNSLEKIPRDEKGLYILECQRAYEEFKRYEP